MKKINILFISFCLITILISACKKDFLNEKVLDKYAPTSLNDKLGFEASAVGLYNHLAWFYENADDQTWLNMFYLGTDITWNPQSKTGGSSRNYHDYTTLTATDGGASRLWTWCYKLINNSNILIYNAEKNNPTGMSQSEKDAYNGEARFFRAYAYNMLATLYGGVPLVTEPLTQPKTDFVRAALADVNAVIEKDLLFAVNSLPEIDAAKEARSNKAMARQLLAEYYLRTNQAAKAEEQCTAIITSGKFKLVTSRYGSTSTPGDAFSDMFKIGKQRRGQGNTEVIWILEQENPTDVPNGSVGSPQQRRNWQAAYHNIAGMKICDSLGGRGLSRIRLDDWVLYKLYDKTDMRNSQYSIRRQFYFNDPSAKYAAVYGKPVPYGKDATFDLGGTNGTIKIAAADTIANITPYTTKWAQFDPRDEFGYGDWKDFILMRLGETYLLRAEARLKQNNTQGAADDINILRVRAQAPTVDASKIDLNFILDERARELIAEENRRMTLVRTGTLVERAKRLCGTAKVANGNIETTNGIQDYNMLLPIPDTEIKLNKDAKLLQNPGY